MEVAPGARPPVCKILDFGKWQYEQQKKEQEARKAQKQVELKEVRLRPKTDIHDTVVKINRARRFLMAGHKVRFRVQFRGREITHPEIAMERLKDVANKLGDVSAVEVRPNMEGRSMFMLLAPENIPDAPAVKAAPAAKDDKPEKKAAPAAAAITDEAVDVAPEVLGDDVPAPAETPAKAKPKKRKKAAPKQSILDDDEDDEVPDRVARKAADKKKATAKKAAVREKASADSDEEKED